MILVSLNDFSSQLFTKNYLKFFLFLDLLLNNTTLDSSNESKNANLGDISNSITSNIPNFKNDESLTQKSNLNPSVNHSSVYMLDSSLDGSFNLSSDRPKRKRKSSYSPEEVIVISSEDESSSSELSSGEPFAQTTTSLTSWANDSSSSSSQNTLEDEKLIESEKKVEEEEQKNIIKIYNSIEEFDANLPETVSILTTPYGSKVYLVGTAHFSQESQDDVSLVIRNVRPDIVMVELCPARIHILKHDEKTLLEEARDINFAKIRNIIHASGVINGVFYVLLLNMSAKLTKELGMAPGGEFRRALEEARRLPNCLLHLGDRPINITLQRALHGLSFWQTLKLIFKLATSNESISKEEVEACKKKDLLEELMREMAGEYPVFGDVFVKERDTYLCHSLQVAALPDAKNGRPVNVVGVIGIGHAQGISEKWGKVDPSIIPKISHIPPASLSNRIAKITIKYGMLSLVGYGVFKLVRPRLQGIF